MFSLLSALRGFWTKCSCQLPAIIDAVALTWRHHDVKRSRILSIICLFSVLRSRRGSHASQKSWYLWGPHRALDHVHGVRQGDLHQRRCHRRWRRVFSYMQLPLKMQSSLMFSKMYGVICVWINIIYTCMWLVVICSLKIRTADVSDSAHDPGFENKNKIKNNKATKHKRKNKKHPTPQKIPTKNNSNNNNKNPQKQNNLMEHVFNLNRINLVALTACPPLSLSFIYRVHD